MVGLILCAQAGMGNMEAGNMYEMYGVAAGVIGGVSPLGGTGILLGTFAGAAVWQTLENGLNMIGAQVGIQRVVIGVIRSCSRIAGCSCKKRPVWKTQKKITCYETKPQMETAGSYKK